MHFKNVFVTEHEIKAEGSDEISNFKLTGAIFEDGLVQMVKKYEGASNHYVSYRGNFNEERTTISGCWFLEKLKDTFMISCSTYNP